MKLKPTEGQPCNSLQQEGHTRRSSSALSQYSNIPHPDTARVTPWRIYYLAMVSRQDLATIAYAFFLMISLASAKWFLAPVDSAS